MPDGLGSSRLGLTEGLTQQRVYRVVCLFVCMFNGKLRQTHWKMRALRQSVIVCGTLRILEKLSNAGGCVHTVVKKLL